MVDKLKDLIELLDLLENNLFGTKRKITIGEKSYYKYEWEEYKAILKKLLKSTKKQQNASAKYLTRNKEYNRKMRLISYYRNKKKKTEKDYIQIENLKVDLEKYLKEKEEKKEKQREKELKEVQEALMNLSNYDE